MTISIAYACNTFLICRLLSSYMEAKFDTIQKKQICTDTDFG
ncbi:hypothetical protein CHCC20335_1135 [Bacillus paralicheniformis]|nr:hypothetical protein CHCC20335_1135 [Bacillus paralicheniformis]